MNSHDRTTHATNSAPSECRAVEDLLVVLSADELEPELALQLRAHLEDCANCQKAFADITRARRLAVGLNLESPELDRYAEFLKRLATNEAADSNAELIPFRADKVSLIADSDDQSGSSPETGVAAVVPLFGNRLIVRNGFGGGFDLQIKSRQGRELVHVSANSLMKAAVVVGGFGIFAASALFAIGFLIVSYFQKPADSLPPVGETNQVPQRPFDGQPGKPFPPRLPWIQSVEGRDHTLSVWKAGHQIQAAFFDRRNSRAFKPFILLMPIPPDRQLLEPGITECAVATNGKSFVVVREHAGTLFAWHLNPVDEVAELSSPPIALGDRALQHGITWAGDRYLVVWIEPDRVAPKIKLLELGSDGRPLQTNSTTVAETLREGEKVGSPAVIARDGNGLIVYQKQGGELMARIWNATELNDATVSIGRHEGILHTRILTAATENAFFVCWAAKTGEGIEISFAELSFRGQLKHKRTLARTRMPVASFDFRAANNHLTLLWAEHVAGALQVISQRFALDGQPIGKPVNVPTNSDMPSAVSFADAEGTTMFWHQPAPNQPVVTIRSIDWKNGQ